MDEIYNLAYTLFYSSIPFLVIGFIGNVLVVRIVHKTREMHTPTNYLLVSIAASDIITILLWPLHFFEVWKFVFVCLYLNQGSKACVVLNAVVSFIQLSIIMYCYGTLIRGLYFTNTVCAETDGERRSEKKKLVITSMMVTFEFFMGYTPTLVSYVIITSGDETTDVSFYTQLTAVADFIFCFNPFIYAFRSTNFKEGFKRVILSRNPQRNNEVAQRS